MLWGISEMVLELPNLCHCLLVGIFGALAESKPLSKQKCVLRKCCRNARAFKPLQLCSAPLKTTSSTFWGSRNERMPLSQQKCCFEKMLWGISEMVNSKDSKSLPLCLATLKNYCRHFWSSRNETKPLSKQKYDLTKCCGVSQQMVKARAY